MALFQGGRIYIWLGIVSVALAAFSLTYPSTPSYDPWSWLIWGRELFHGQLILAGGSSWKPLPVIFTTAAAAFGSAQPDLWLLVARTGAVLTVLMATKLALRITWHWCLHGREDNWFAGLDRFGKAAAIAPALLAAAIALAGTTFTPTYPGNMLLGYSEGLMVAATLIAAERAWDGHHRQAFALGIIPALDRPEFWPIWGLYGLWLIWKHPETRALVVGMVVLMLALWVVPQRLGGLTVMGLFTHPQKNHAHTSAVYSSFPFWTELRTKVGPLTPQRVELVSLVLIAATAVAVLRAKRALGSWTEAVRSHGPAVAAAFAGAVGFGWWLGIALETQDGFAGNPRYAILGSVLIYVSGAAGYGWAAMALARLAGAASRRLRGLGRVARPGWKWRAVGAVVIIAAVFTFVPRLWYGNSNVYYQFPTFHSVRTAMRYEAHVREDVASLIRRGGGSGRVMRCGGNPGPVHHYGSVMANNLHLTMVAWYMKVPIPWIQAQPKTYDAHERGPNVVFQSAVTPGAPMVPSPAQISAWERAGSHYKVFTGTVAKMYLDCSAWSAT